MLTPEEFPQIAAQVEGMPPRRQLRRRPCADARRRAGGDHFRAAAGRRMRRRALPRSTTDGDVRPLAEIEAADDSPRARALRRRMTLVARKLGIGRSTLYRKLKELGLSDITAGHCSRVSRSIHFDSSGLRLNGGTAGMPSEATNLPSRRWVASGLAMVVRSLSGFFVCAVAICRRRQRRRPTGEGCARRSLSRPRRPSSPLGVDHYWSTPRSSTQFRPRSAMALDSAGPEWRLPRQARRRRRRRLLCRAAIRAGVDRRRHADRAGAATSSRGLARGRRRRSRRPRLPDAAARSRQGRPRRTRPTRPRPTSSSAKAIVTYARHAYAGRLVPVAGQRQYRLRAAPAGPGRGARRGRRRPPTRPPPSPRSIRRSRSSPPFATSSPSCAEPAERPMPAGRDPGRTDAEARRQRSARAAAPGPLRSAGRRRRSGAL